jgi:hypothetical protein
MSRVRIALLAGAATLIAGMVIAGLLIAGGSRDDHDERLPKPRVSAAQVERNLEHEYRCELGFRRATATCRPKGGARFSCEVADPRGIGTRTVELEIDGATYEPVPGC